MLLFVPMKDDVENFDIDFNVGRLRDFTQKFSFLPNYQKI
jgi:hypothetical protein